MHMRSSPGAVPWQSLELYPRLNIIHCGAWQSSGKLHILPISRLGRRAVFLMKKQNYLRQLLQCDPLNPTMNSTLPLLVLTHISAEAVGMVRLSHAEWCAIEGVLKGQNKDSSRHMC